MFFKRRSVVFLTWLSFCSEWSTLVSGRLVSLIAASLLWCRLSYGNSALRRLEGALVMSPVIFVWPKHRGRNAVNYLVTFFLATGLMTALVPNCICYVLFLISGPSIAAVLAPVLVRYSYFIVTIRIIEFNLSKYAYSPSSVLYLAIDFLSPSRECWCLSCQLFPFFRLWAFADWLLTVYANSILGLWDYQKKIMDESRILTYNSKGIIQNHD